MLLKPTTNNIIKCSKIIKNGGIVAFPTETVYGLGACAFNEEAVKKIFEIKKRPKCDPLIVHISSYKQLKEIAYIESKIIDLLENFWPGPLTIVLKKKKNIPDIVSGNLDSVAIRMPSNKIALKLIKYSKCPIAAPSANKFSRLSPTKPEHVIKYFPDIPIIEGGKTVFGIESTVIKIDGRNLYVLRHGAIPVEVIKRFWNEKIIEYSGKLKLSPGLIKKHYSPIKPLRIIKNQSEIKKPEKAGFISFGEKPTKKYALFLDLSPSKSLDEAAKNLFDYLHIADENINVKEIYVKSVPEKGIGKAIMERLKKASC